LRKHEPKKGSFCAKILLDNVMLNSEIPFPKNNAAKRGFELLN